MNLENNVNYQRAVTLRNLKDEELQDVKGVLTLIEKLNESNSVLDSTVSERDITIKDLRLKVKRTEAEVTNSLLESLTVTAEKNFKVSLAKAETDYKTKEDLHKVQLAASETNRSVAQEKVNILEYALLVAKNKIAQLKAELEILKPTPEPLPEEPVVLPTL